ncbi:hypothetical protein BANRA_04794 [Escherichia coli]|nr:hypothetical protein BANRA_04794 [Escherichia coli]
MKYQVKEFINENILRLLIILKDNLKEHYHFMV